jgi:hypothetical protein
MPWYREAMKDVVSCEKPRVGANNRRFVDIRMGQPDPGNAGSFFCSNAGGGERREVKHLSTFRSRNRRDSLSSGERRGRSLNLASCISLQALCAGGSGMYLGGFAGSPWSKKFMI